MSAVYEFGAFRLDPAERLLVRDGQPVALTPKAFDLVVYLVEHQGRLVEKATLMAALWPDTIVEEANLAFQISALRKALGDDREDAKFIETVPTRGYRFVAPVVETHPEESRPEPARRKGRLAAVAILGLVAVATVVLWTTGLVRNRGPAAPVFTQLTANPAEVPVISQAISPDGKYLAYADLAAMHVQVIASGETQTLPDTPGLFILGWNADGTQIRAVDWLKADIVWDVSLVGGARRRSGLRLPPDAVSVAPDGSRFLTQSPDRKLHIVPVHGVPQDVAPLGGYVTLVVWTSDAKRAFFLREGGEAIETFDVQQGEASVAFKAPSGQFIEAIGPPGDDGRLVTLMGRYGRRDVKDVWEIPVNVETGLLSGEPRRLSDWRQWGCYQISRSSDGRQVAFLSYHDDWDVYAADFDARTSRLGSPRRLSMSEWDDQPSAWLPDNRSVIFSSARTGRQRDIYRQDIDGAEPQLLVSNDEDKQLPRVTPDGRWILFRQAPINTWPKGNRVMRVPIDGGIAEEIYASSGHAYPTCPISGGCILYDGRDGGNAVLYALDPIRGKGAALATIPPTGGGYLMPDGTEFSYLVESAQPRNHIRFVSFHGKPSKDIIVRGVGDLENIEPLPDGSGWVAANHRTPTSFAELVHITRDGTSHVLWAPERMRVDSAMPSRDGKQLAIATITRTGNVWLMTNPQK